MEGHPTPQKRQQSEFICHMHFHTHIPPVPFEPKLLTYLFKTDHLSKYCSQALERQYRWEFHTAQATGLPIDLIDPHAFQIPEDADKHMHPDDKALLKAPESQKPSKKQQKRDHYQAVRNHASWLRKSELIHNEFDSRDTDYAQEVKQIQEKEKVSSPRESIIKSIEDSFELAQKDIVHHPKNGKVSAKAVMPLFPIENGYFGKTEYTHIFQPDPPFDISPTGHPNTALKTTHNQTQSLFIKEDATEQPDLEEDTYSRICQYTQSTTQVPDPKDKCFIILDKDAAYYEAFHCRLNLRQVDVVQ